jgi:hypothetical protein
MTLGEQQAQFTRMIGALINRATELGYDLTFGDAWATDGHKEDSFHYKRLAVDFNLFIDGEYQRNTIAHLPLGEYWESIGGTWGGRFGRKDGNHYSFGE